MRLTTRIVVAATVVAVMVPAAPATATSGTGPAAQRPATPLAAGRPSRTVTLITGDRLSVATDGSHDFAVIPTPGREHFTFVTNVVRGHLEVTPVDAVQLVREGRLDGRLFDVTALLSYGYDDRRADLPLIVTARGGGSRVTVSAAGATVTRDLPAVNGYAVTVGRAHATGYWNSLTTPTGARTRVLRDDVDQIWLDAKARLSLDASVPQIGAPTAWAAGYTGAGVAVGVLDTGIDDTHPDLAGRVVAAQDFTGTGDTVDRVGHGTHVASTIAGSGAASDGTYKGVAPDSKLHSAKVCLTDGCAYSWIIAGMQWAAEVQRAKVVNMSLSGADTPGLDPLEQAVQTLTAKFGTLFVTAAGNDGVDGSVGSPSTADHALSVGAVDKTGRLAGFSSRGPRTGDHGVKPEITAPGVGIVAARATEGAPGAPGGRYTSMQGTSMATPHVAGSAAILAQRHPEWTSARLKAALMASAKPNPAIGVYAQGAGRVDVARAIGQQVTSSPTAVNFGRQDWPHTDDEALTSTVTYHNAGPTPVTLTLAMHTTGPDGRPTAGGLFTVSPAMVTVPAGADAGVAVTADTRLGSADGILGGHLTATADGVSVQTPVAVIRDIESYELALKVVDRTGSAGTSYGAHLYGLDTSSYRLLFDASGTVTVRLPAGRYNLFTVVYEQDGSGGVSMLVQPVVRLDRRRTVTLDARSAKPISVSVPHPTARIGMGGVQYTLPGRDGTVASGLTSSVLDGIYTAQVGPRTPVDGFTTRVQTTWGEPQPNGWMTDTPYQYHLLWPQRGSFITGFHRDVVQRDLATVHKDVAASANGVWGQAVSFGHVQGSGGSSWALAYLYSASASHVEYYNAEPGLRWASRFVEQVPLFIFWRELSRVFGPYVAYQRGRAYRETWNRGVFGPVFPDRSVPENWLTRTGDTLVVNTPAYGDGSGRAGTSVTDSASVTVYKDGVQVGTEPELSGRFTVPAAPGRYRVVQEGSRDTTFALSTKVSTAWTFGSGHVDGTTPAPLPVSAVRFSPRLDAQNTAPSNGLFGIAVRVQRQPGSAARRTGLLDVQVSYDDGQTWTRALVLGHGDNRIALLRHPAGSGFVSLKARAADVAGNAVEQTIIRAYRF